MFHSAALKLTTWYLAIIMALSIGCSIALYHVSSNDLEQNAHRQVGYFDNFLGPDDLLNYSQLRQSQLNDDRDHLKASLILFNVVVLLLGGGASYGLARRTLEPIEESLEAQKRFTGDASHELRTPLAAMQTEIEVALRDQGLTKTEAVKLLRSNLEEVGKLKSLSDGLLRLTTENGKNLTLTPLPVREVISSAVARYAKAAAAKRIAVKQNVSDIQVIADQQSLTDLVSILLDNAIKYSPVGGEITVSSRKSGKNALIVVADHGQGINAADLPHIFERFYRADSSRNKDQADGYGLGLAIAQKITGLHHGSITVKSAPGRGSTFTIQLPGA
jgi:two-component system sensor histidine kinase CiaH